MAFWLLEINTISNQSIIHNNSNLATHLDALFGRSEGVLDALLVDLGVSSMQLDTPERGFSFRHLDAPLDMRMDGTGAWASAEDLVNTWPEGDLGRVLREYGEEPRWRLVAKRCV